MLVGTMDSGVECSKERGGDTNVGRVGPACRTLSWAWCVARIAVFGSTAQSERHDRDSDIDLAVVVDTPSTFDSYDERLEVTSRVRAPLVDINAEVSIDILVYRRGILRLSGESGFVASEVSGKGHTMYAKAG